MLDFDFDPSMPEWAKRLATFDLETTGLDLRESRIVTACVAVLNQNGEVEEVHEWLVDPGIEIPEAASNVHGVTTEMARASGVAPQGAVQEILQALEKLSVSMPLVAFNAAYDFSILHSEALRYGFTPLDPKPVIDPLILDRQMVKFRKGKRTLTALCPDYGVALDNAHNSTADAVAAGRLAQSQSVKFEALNVSAGELHASQKIWADEQALEFEKYMKTQNRPDFRAELGWPTKF
jgi:DNA polymerase III subunit epsilon